MAEQKHVLEEDIELREYIDVIIKRKNLILAVFFVSVIASVVINLTLPRIYEVSMIIEPSSFTVNKSGSPVFIDPPNNLKLKIEAGAFDLNVVNALKINPQDAGGVKVSQPKDSTFLKLSMIRPESKKAEGLKVLDQYLIELTSFYKNITDSKKREMDERISIINNTINSKEGSVNLNEKNLEIMDVREKELMDELKDIKNNTEQLLAKRSLLAENNKDGGALPSLLYSNTIQQNISYFNQLNNQLASNKIKKEEIVNNITVLKNEIGSLKIEIEKLKILKASIQDINIIQKPRVSLQPVGPKRKQNVMLTGILSLMGGAFLAFFIELLEKSRKPVK